MAVIARYRKRTVDYRALVESCACESPRQAASVCGDIEHEFLCGIMDRPAIRAKLPGFLQGLEELDSRVRAGLLKTWIHSGILSAAVREAEFLGMRQGNRCEVRPIDAMVAPFGRCNLACLGCYAAGQLDQPGASPARLNDVVGQLKRLNVYHVLLVGKGEPFYDNESRQCLFEVVRRHPQVFFSVYSNGTTISPGDIRRLRKVPNLIPVLSLDGPEAINDWRRGTGVYHKVADAFKRMRDQGLLFGYISTVFQQNCQAVLDPQFVDQMAGFGCRLGYYSLFIAPQGADGATDCRRMMLDSHEREEYCRRFEILDSAVRMPLVDVDGIEAHVGCRAKRGATVYVDALTGQVSPCIRAPLDAAECNVYRPGGHGRLAEILRSGPFRQYRQDQPATQTCEAFIKADLLACGVRHVELTP
ncbi:MAG: radical SAM protein [Thermoguttaceae bacterium]